MKLRKSLVKPDVAEYIELFGSYTRDTYTPTPSSHTLLLLSCTTHLMLFTERPPIYGSLCMTISGERTEQHVVIGFGKLAAVD